MVFITSVLPLLLAPLAMAMPTILPRAGGPSVTPIPANCTSTAVVPSSGAANFTLTPSFIATNQVYEFILSPDNNPYGSADALWLVCQEQCYGYGNDGDCVATLFAENVTGMSYGFPVNGFGCLMFGADIEETDLLETSDGSYANAAVLDRSCPSPRA